MILTAFNMGANVSISTVMVPAVVKGETGVFKLTLEEASWIRKSLNEHPILIRCFSQSQN